MKQVFRIMEIAYLEPRKYNGKDLMHKFGDKTYKRFSDFAFTAEKPYAKLRGEDSKVELTGDGIRVFYEIAKHEEDRLRTEAMIFATGAMAAGSAVIGISTIYGSLPFIKPEDTAICLLIIYMVIFIGTILLMNRRRWVD